MPSAFSRFAAVALLAGTASCQAGPPVEADPAARVEWAREAFRTAVTADEEGDDAAALAAMRQAVALRPQHPTLLVNQAAMEVRSGHHARARLILAKLARMGVGLDVRAEPAFAPLAGRPDFERTADLLRANREPFGETPLQLRHEMPHYRMPLPEGVAYDPRERHFYLSGVASGQLVRMEWDGDAPEDFHVVERGLGVFGLAFDAERRRLWAVGHLPEGRTAPTEYAPFPLRSVGPPEPGRSALFALDVDRTEVGGIFSHGPVSLRCPRARIAVPGEQPAALNDLTVLADGRVIVSDAAGGTLWAYRPPEKGLFPTAVRSVDAGEEVLVPADPDAPADPGLQPYLQGPPLPSPQGLAQAGKWLYLADYSTGLHRINPTTGARIGLWKPEDLCDLGIDGLIAADDRHLVAIQNGFAPQRILWLTLDEDGRAITDWQVLAAGLPEWNEPTLGTVHDGWLYFVANSHWPEFTDFTKPVPSERLTPPEIRKLRLPAGE